MNRTVIEWFKGLPDEHKGKAIKNISKDVFMRGAKVDSLSAALKMGFWWKASPEGEQYWKAVCARLI